jgi:serine/threonine protein kinase
MGKRATVFAGRWKCGDGVGEGGNAWVCHARDLRAESSGDSRGSGAGTGWVLKVFKNQTRVARHEAEIRAMRTLRSPHVLQVEDFSLDPPAFLVVPFAGEDLEKYVRRRRLSLLEALRLFEQIVTGVRDAHQAGVAHRDLKPDNIFVGAAGTAMVGYFGLCQIFGDSVQLTTTGEILGTAAFAAPECLPGSAQRCGMPSDIYSLGKLLYWMASGGKVIHREAITDALVGAIEHPVPWVRQYIRGVLDRTVREEAAQRCDAQKLLEDVGCARALVDGAERRWAPDVLTLWDGFWLADSFNASSSRSATRSDGGDSGGGA